MTSAPTFVAGAPGPGVAVATRGLVKRYGSRPALQGLDLTVPRGTVYGFLGPNGSGKTTTLRLLVGLLRPDAGSIDLLGRPYVWRDRRRLFTVGSLIEAPSFYPYLSGHDNLRVLAAAGPPTRASRVDEVLEYVGLRDRARDKAKTYSLGMKQRLGIAGALLGDPELLLLDEPANGLDPAGIKAMRELLRFLTSQRKTVLVSSHILPEVEQLADVVGIVDRGRLVREGPLSGLLSESVRIRARVAAQEVEAAMAALADLGPQPVADPRSAGHAWIEVRRPGELAAEINRRLAGAGIYASGLESGSDLEAIFLAATAVAPAAAAGPSPGPGRGQPQGPA